MNNNRLIKQCVCGNDNNFSQHIKNNLKILECSKCGIIHQYLENWNEEKYYDFYKSDYHVKFQNQKQVSTYEDRYVHDCKISSLRLNSYMEYIKPGMFGLDIGSSNSAFVHTANELGFKCIGLEPGNNIGDNNVTIRGILKTANLPTNYFDFVTMHDSIEHMIDVNESLIKVNQIMKNDGLLIIDLPDYFIEQGKHHWKFIEHLWLFTEQQFLNLLEKFNFKIVKITKPIPGKLVFYARKI